MWIKALLATGLLLFSGAARALDYCDSGSWYEPRTEGQGLSVEISKQLLFFTPDVVIYYFTYDGFGNPIWYLGIGDQPSFGDSVDVRFTLFRGMTPPDFIPIYREQYNAGTGTFTLVNKYTAYFTFIPEDIAIEQGHTIQTFILQKLFNICTND